MGQPAIATMPESRRIRLGRVKFISVFDCMRDILTKTKTAAGDCPANLKRY